MKALPKVRKLARERGIDLATVTGTGPGGSVTVADLDAATAATATGGRRERMSALRRSIARHMAESAQIPQFTSMAERAPPTPTTNTTSRGLRNDMCC